MEYIHSQWHHDDDLEPTDLYFEIDDERYALRGVYRFANGDLHRVTRIEGQIPPVKEINDGIDFSTTTISQETFENLWQEAKSEAGI
jgi:hypothetical protein